MTQIAPIENLPVRRTADPTEQPPEDDDPPPEAAQADPATRLASAATPAAGLDPHPHPQHPRPHPRCGPRPLHRAGLRRHEPQRDRRAARRHQGRALLPLRVQGRHPHGAPHAPARVRQGRPQQDAGRARQPRAVGQAPRRGPRPDAGPAQDIPHARAEPGRPREVAPGRARPGARGHPEPVPPGPGRRPAVPARTGSAWRRRSASSSRASSSPAMPSTIPTNAELGDMLREIVRDVVQG